MRPVTPPTVAPEEYRGAKLHLALRSLDNVMVDLLGTVLHRHYFQREYAKKLIDWYVDTGADPSRLPPPYKAISPRI